jgi:glycosyltransferase involved in cell wall biosynthesis
MRIGIDAHAAERDGTGNCTYIRNLLRQLGQLDKENLYFIYATDPSHSFYKEIENLANFSIRKIPVKNPCLRIPFFLAGLTWKDRLDILHVQYIAPPLHRGKLIVTIHDLGHFFIPQSFSRFEVLRSKILIPQSARKAARILTGSFYSRATIIERFGISPDKISVTPYGVAEDFFQAQKEVFKAEGKDFQDKENLKIKTILKKYGIQKPYILSLSRLNLRKNLALVIESYNLLKNRNNLPHKLVIAGKPDVKAGEIKKMASSSAFCREIIFTGYIHDQDLPYVYSQAELFLFLSEFEGFGLPVLEAMACGVPVLTTAKTSLPEVAGEAALYVSTLSPLEIVTKIEALLFDQNFRSLLVTKGRQRASMFTWEKTAKLTLEIYRQAAENKKI